VDAPVGRGRVLAEIGWVTPEGSTNSRVPFTASFPSMLASDALPVDCRVALAAPVGRGRLVADTGMADARS
jgi:hypothetical protein